MYSYPIAIFLVIATSLGCATGIAQSSKDLQRNVASIYLDVQHNGGE